MDQIDDLYESRALTIIGVVTFVLTVATTAVALRVYTRACLIRQMGLDDWTAILAMLLIIACGFCVAWNTRYGFASHIYIVDESMIPLYMRTFYVSIVFYNAALMAVKMTFLFQYYRILAVQRMRKVLICATVLVGGWSLSQVLVEIFICTPIEAFWDAEAAATGTCIPNIPQWYINAGGNILTDIMVFALPLPVLWKLKMRRGQKWILVGIFCLGFFTCTISFVRIKYLRLTEDFTWDNVDSAAWSIGELCSGITCACLPTLRPLVAKFFPRLGGSRSSPSQGYFSGGTNPLSDNPRHNHHHHHHDTELGTGVRINHGKNMMVTTTASDSDSRHELTHEASHEEDLFKRYEMDGGGVAGAGRGRGVSEVASQGSDGSSEGVMYGLRPERGTAYLQTEISAGGGGGGLGVPRPREEMGAIQVERDIVQVTSSKKGRR